MWPEYDQIKNKRRIGNIKMEVNNIIWYNEHKILVDNTIYVKESIQLKRLLKNQLTAL